MEKRIEGEDKAFSYAETVRGHKRRSLEAECCAQCKKYYEEVGGGRMEEVSRHRNSFRRPPSPDDFWDIGLF